MLPIAGVCGLVVLQTAGVCGLVVLQTAGVCVDWLYHRPGSIVCVCTWCVYWQ